MAEDFDIAEVSSDLEEGGRAVAELARNPDQFAAAIKAFRAHDGEAWQAVLTRAQLFIHCHRVCHWVVSKECVRVCILLAGPPREAISVDQIGPFTAVVARLAEQPKLIEKLAVAVECEDREAFQAVVAELKAQRFVHLLCHWVCFIRYVLVCRVICERLQWDRVQYVAQLRDSAVAIASVARKPDQLGRLVDGAVRLNCAAVKDIFGAHQDCRLICWWLCSWRCLVVCLRLTHSFDMAGDFSIGEMRDFAMLSGEAVRDPAGLNALATAVAGQDEKAFASYVRGHKAKRFAHQFCHWVCYLVCRRFCICVCPPPAIIPLFTHVGQYRVDPYYRDFAGDGTTAPVPHPPFVPPAAPPPAPPVGVLAFTGTIELRGLLPDSPPGDPVEYRFTAENLAGGGAHPLTDNEIVDTVIGDLEFKEWDPTALPAPGQWVTRSCDYWVSNTDKTRSIVQNGAAPLVVPVSTGIDAAGWIRVPGENNLVPFGGGRFVRNRPELARLETTQLTFEPFDLTAAGPGLPVIAGMTVPPAMRSVKPVFRIAFEARKGIGHAPIAGNTLPKIALSNTQYTYTRHPDWAGSTVSPPMVVSLDIAELIDHGCDPINAGVDIHALFTVYHPYLASCSLSIEGPAPVPAPVSPAVAAGEALSPAGGQAMGTAALQPCAYILWLTAVWNLTSGYGRIDGEPSDHIAFCVHEAPKKPRP